MARTRTVILVSVMVLAMSVLRADAQTKCTGAFPVLLMGNDLHAYLKSQGADKFFANGYVLGAVESFGYLYSSGKPSKWFQLPPGVTTAQILKVMENHLDRNPD